ncbi:adenosine kinase [Termitidicoccus mucosus]|uniref:Ribokinase n=1 Tax=Termitidicoccus mucosus TaxID=1184151 RepID=A0A178ILA9_9BACT|nr:ribokinase [Opitutaceae bacterium TSB47]
MPNPPANPILDLVGVGAPIMDLVASVPDSFLSEAGGEKGGMVMIDATEMRRLVGKLPLPPAITNGGSAANTTYNAARLGLRTAFVGKLGNDALADDYRARFAAAAVGTGRFKRGLLPNACCLNLTTPDTQRTMRTCLGAHATLSPSEITPADFAGARHAHIEGFVVFNRDLADAIVNAARAAGCTISLDLASFEVVRGARDWLLPQLGRGIDVVFANEDEIRALFPDAQDAADYAAHARRLASFGGVAAVKLGRDGAWIARGKELHRIAPVSVADAIDSNGAGDAWAAGFLAGWLRGRPLPECGKLASLLGAETVRHMGPLIPAAHWPAIATKAAAHLPS